MTHYLLISTDGSCWTQSIQPLTLDDIETMLPFSTPDDATMAKDMYYAHKPVPRTVATIERVTALEAEISEYKAINKRLVEAIDKLHEKNTQERACITKLRQILRRVMSLLAVQNTLQNTHSERNKQNGEIVRDIHFWVELPINQFSDSVIESDDIPF